eukprot:1139399-Pelagomonas_calceolata.AAC.1
MSPSFKGLSSSHPPHHSVRRGRSHLYPSHCGTLEPLKELAPDALLRRLLSLLRHGLLLVTLLMLPIDSSFAPLGEGDTQCLDPRHPLILYCGEPGGTYACQVWGTEYFQEGSELKRQLQKRQLCSLWRFLGVKSTATNKGYKGKRPQSRRSTASLFIIAKCEEYCHELASIERVWPRALTVLLVRATVKFFNNMLVSNVETLRQVLKADSHLADRGES